MGRIKVEVLPKFEILDRQGKAVIAALNRVDVTAFKSVRQGKTFYLETAGEVTEADLEAAREVAATVLSNPNIEDVVSVEVLEDER
ncbi:MAG: phosphoribosylformylglycinamidine synthase subunit PurS [Actinomycetaceae bacterium]|nr:phosphoribosylformylglycinamidine synthase subunit PurS [Actinomycetaceae bacterium]